MQNLFATNTQSPVNQNISSNNLNANIDLGSKNLNNSDFNTMQNLFATNSQSSQFKTSSNGVKVN
jgi:hypothetical protein